MANTKRGKLELVVWLLILPSLVVACRSDLPKPQPTLAPDLPTLVPAPSPSASPMPLVSSPTQLFVPPTFTSEPVSELPSPTSAGASFPTVRSTSLVLPTNTPTITPTVTITLEATLSVESPTSPAAEATSTADGQMTPAAPPAPSAPNLLPNPSFEEGWYHHNGIPELQVPNRWNFEWQVGGNNLDSDPWNAYVRPESRLLNGDFLPANEHPVFIWDGDYTVKIFKKTGAVHFRLTTDVALDPGTYLFRINFFPDLISGYLSSGQKVWAPDPLSGDVQFILDNPIGTWHLPTFGQKNTLDFVFDVSESRFFRLGAAFRGRWAIENNGWFMDDWSLQKIDEPPTG